MCNGVAGSFFFFSDDVNLNAEEEIAETCALELLDKPPMVRRGQTGVKSRETHYSSRCISSPFNKHPVPGFVHYLKGNTTNFPHYSVFTSVEKYECKACSIV